MRRLFNGKCAYCEQPVGKPAKVDHFRPTSNAADKRQTDPHHYAWLAYEWANLYLACRTCVGRRENLFPVMGSRAPLLSSLDEVRELESPLLLDAAQDRPERHLDFAVSGRCVARSRRGTESIDVFRLNRSDLVRARAERFKALHALMRKAGEASKISEKLAAFMAPEAAFAGGSNILLHRFALALARRLGAQPPKFNRTAAGIVRLVGKASLEIRRAAAAEVRQELESATTAEPVDVVVEMAESVASVRPRTDRAVPPLRRIEIRDFKAIECLDIDMAAYRHGTSADASCLMLLGENATGKSTILEAVALALIGPEQANRLGIKASDFIRRRDPQRWQLVDARPASVKIDFYDRDVPAELNIAASGQRFEGRRSAGYPVVGYGARRYFTKDRRRRGRAARERVRGLFDVMATVPHPGPWLENLDEARFNAVARALREILALRETDDLLRDEQLGICVSAHGQLTPLERLSDGYRSLFAMVVDAMRSILDTANELETARGVVLIDEIETHLHPRWKMTVMTALRKAMPRIQFIATTHDPLCLRGMDDGEVQVLNRDEQQHIERLEGLPNVKGLRAEQLLTSDYFGLSSTADPETEIELARLADSLRQPTGSAEIARLQEQLSKTVVLGDTPAQQVVAEAMKQYLGAREGESAPARTQARKNAVSTFLQALEANERKRPS